MNSQTTDEFWALFRALPANVRLQAQKAYQQFQRDPFHPSLRFKEIDKQRHLWSARVTRGYRVIGQRSGSQVIWTWIGTHGEYDRRIRHS